MGRIGEGWLGWCGDRCRACGSGSTTTTMAVGKGRDWGRTFNLSRLWPAELLANAECHPHLDHWLMGNFNLELSETSHELLTPGFNSHHLGQQNMYFLDLIWFPLVSSYSQTIATALHLTYCCIYCILPKTKRFVELGYLMWWPTFLKSSWLGWAVKGLELWGNCFVQVALHVSIWAT